jgi:3-methyl-2-oxobutanoate hydroxymethyltransferase
VSPVEGDGKLPAMADTVTAPSIRAMKKRGEKIVCVTAYDAYFARLADDSGVDLILVGDSLGNVVLGYSTTVPVTLEDMVHHTRAASRGVSRALLVADLPFGSYQASTEQAVLSSVALMKAGASAVKLEGVYVEAIGAIVKAGIPVMGHIGMTPQSVHKFGGFKVQGKGDTASALVNSARAIEDAGVFSMVLELVSSAAADQVSSAVSVPTIGIGAGAGCDGQIQVMHDILGLSDETFRHAKRFVGGQELLLNGFRSYAEAVRSGSFPADENSF